MKNSFKKLFTSLFTLAFIITTPFAWGADTLLMNGAGATFPYPLYSKWFYEYQKKNPNVKFNYQSIGSGGGIQQILSKTVDFGASDAPMSDLELTKVKEPLLHIPTVLGAVVIAYNLPAVGTGLKLTGPIIAEIFLGKITKWNDPQIVTINPDKPLLNQPILVVHRSDGSGTTYVFSDYLSKISRNWLVRAGTGKSINWPAGLGAKGNEGVTGLVKQTPGSIGYIELGYAVQNNLPVALVQNKAGNFIEPNIASISAAAAETKIPEDYRVSLTHPVGASAYPISSFTYLLVYERQPDHQKAKAFHDFLTWCFHEGQTMASPLHYAPLPSAVITRLEKTTTKIGPLQ